MALSLPLWGPLPFLVLTSSFPAVPPSPQNSLCASGPGSTTQESSAGALAREAAGSLPPACMPTLRGGFQELGPEELQRLLLDVGVVKGSYRRTDVSGRRVGRGGRHRGGEGVRGGR